MVNAALFKYHMAKNCETQDVLAGAMGISTSRLNAKINENGGAEFWQSEIMFIRAHYGLSADEVNQIFFAEKVS